MPDSPSDHPLAELFGTLPTPRTPSVDPQASTEASDVVAAPAPGSRRAAREAARAATGAVPTADPSPIVSQVRSTTSAHAVPAPHVPPASAHSAPPAAAATAPAHAPSSVQATDAALSADGTLAGLRAPVSVATTPLSTPDADLWLAEDHDAQTASARPSSPTGGNAIIPQVDAAAGETATPPTLTGPTRIPLDDAGLAYLFGPSTSDAPDVQAPPRRRRRIGGWIAFGIVLLLLGGIAAGGVWVWNTYEDKIREVMGWEEPKDYEEGLATGEALVTISSGDTGSAISQSLYDAGVTKTPEAFYDMLVDTAQNPTFYPGVYRLQQKMTSAAALAALQDPTNKLENSAMLREGLTVEQLLPILSESLGIPLADFEAAVADPSVYGVSGDSLEGWLFPAMYTFDPGATATDVIQTMVDRTVQSLDAAGVAPQERQRILTIASIIQREARFEADFYRVSRVIQNRLDPANQQTFGLLQMDSTAQYGFGEMHDGTVSSSQEALDDDNPWNTYIHPGLPVGPIANPGDTAIDAAMHPADGPWLYFVTVNPDTGETVFTETIQDHEKYVAQWQEWCTANPGKC